MSAELAIAAGHIREAMDRLQSGIDLLKQCPGAEDLVVSAEYQHHRLDTIHRLTLGAIERAQQAETAAGGNHGKHGRQGG